MLDDLIELPEGWEWVTVEESIGIIDYRGRTPPFSDSGIPHLRSSNIKNGKIVWEGLRYISEETYIDYMTRGIPQKGDILFTTEAPLGDVALAPEEKFSLAQRMMLLRPNPELIQSEFLLFQIQNEDFQNKLRITSTGSTVSGVSSRNFKPLEIQLPPLNEQKRIVAKIEELRSHTQAARNTIAHIPKLLEQFRQSVLVAAFKGDLTAEWRSENPDVEPAEVLLERIRKEREENAKTQTQLQKLSEIYHYKEEEDSDTLANSWRYYALEKLAESLQYGTSAKSDQSGKVVVLRMGNLQNGEIDWNDLAYTSDEIEINKYKLQSGSILFNRTNSPELVGKTSIYRGEHPAIFAGYLIRIHYFDRVLDAEYLNFCLNTSYARDYCWKVKTDGVSQSNINAQKLGKFEVPLCSLEEQREIIRQVNLLLNSIDRIEEQYQFTKTELDRLDRSILAKAFKGELVPQDPTDEPAIVLLERIRNDRASQTKPAKTKRKKV